jgi:glycerol-3-phosphate O-acyltransferase
VLPDDITQAVLAREDVARYLRGGHGASELDARERIHAYLDELRTTQRYPIYRALKHPLYPILRKIERIYEHVRIAQESTRRGRVIYISDHKSHLDYLVEPLALDDNGIRPPVLAALTSERVESHIIPMAVAYDLVLEDRILAHQATKRRSRPFAREVAEMVRYAVGYQSRAFVTFGEPIPLKGYDAESRRDVMTLAHRVRDTIGVLYKVLPTAVVAAAMRPNISSKELEARAQAVIDAAASAGGNMGVTSGRDAVDQARGPLETRNIIHIARDGRFRVRERTVLRYYARTLDHLLSGSRRSPRTH